MTSHQASERGVIVDHAGRAVYAVPRPVLEAHQATPEQRAAFAAAAPAVSLPADHALHVLSEKDLEPYRLSDTERETLTASLRDAAGSEDVGGFQLIGRFPSDTYLWVEPYGPQKMDPRDAVATYSLLGYYPPLR